MSYSNLIAPLPKSPMDITVNSVNASSHLSSQGTVPVLSAAVNWSLGPTIDVDSTDVCGSITGTTSAASGTFVLTFANAFPAGAKPIVLLHSNSAAAVTNVYASSISNTGFTVTTASAGGVSGIILNYIVMANVA